MSFSFQDFLDAVPVPSIQQELQQQRRQQNGVLEKSNIHVFYPLSDKGQAVLQKAAEILAFFEGAVERKLADVHVYLALATEPKRRPQEGQSFSEENINGGLTFLRRPPVVLVYREQEWEKVLMHELFHAVGLEVKKDTSMSVEFTSSGRKTSIDWTESLVEVSASYLQQLFLGVGGDDGALQAFAAKEVDYLQKTISLLLSTAGPAKDQNGPGYLILKYLFWQKFQVNPHETEKWLRALWTQRRAVDFQTDLLPWIRQSQPHFPFTDAEGKQLWLSSSSSSFGHSRKLSPNEPWLLESFSKRGGGHGGGGRRSRKRRGGGGGGRRGSRKKRVRPLWKPRRAHAFLQSRAMHSSSARKRKRPLHLLSLLVD